MNKMQGKITKIPTIKGNVNSAMIYPVLEDLTVTPSGEEQHFKSKLYGYDNVTVKAVEGEELNISPSIEEQQYKGLFDTVNVKGIETEELHIIPSIETQVKEGMYNKVTVTGDEDLKAENIKQGVNIFGVEGIAKTSNAKITDATYLFYGGSRKDYLNEILSLCENVTSTEYMFNGCNSLTNLDLSNFNTSNVTSMSNMFNGCSSLATLNISNFNTSNVTDMSNMFYGCSSLTELDLSNFNTSNVTSMAYMFYRCSRLTEVDLSNFDMSKVNDISQIFTICSNLTNINSFKNLGKGYTQKSNNYSNYKLDLNGCTKLTHDSLMSVINNLYDLNLTYNVANGGTLYTQTLNLGATNKAKLTADEIAIATNKGWNVT